MKNNISGLNTIEVKLELYPTSRPSIICMHIENEDFQIVTSYDTHYPPVYSIFTNKTLICSYGDIKYSSTDKFDSDYLINPKFVQEYLDNPNRDNEKYYLEVIDDRIVYYDDNNYVIIHKVVIESEESNTSKNITIVDGIRHMTKEFILCAAIHVNDGNRYNGSALNITEGFIITGRRHSDCYNIIESMCSIVGKHDYINSIQKLAPRQHQGFMTSHNRYVDRKEAYKIAKENNQIWHDMSCKDIAELASEDLYYP